MQIAYREETVILLIKNGKITMRKLKSSHYGLELNLMKETGILLLENEKQKSDVKTEITTLLSTS